VGEASLTALAQRVAERTVRYATVTDTRVTVPVSLLEEEREACCEESSTLGYTLWLRAVLRRQDSLRPSPVSLLGILSYVPEYQLYDRLVGIRRPSVGGMVTR